MRAACAALVFLTRLPAGRLAVDDFARAPGWFAAVGLGIGAALALVWTGAAALWPPVVAALVTVAAGLMLTGALHEDGLADTFDGLGSGHPAGRALEIMRDSRIGSFGALALGLVLAGRVAALAALGPLAPAVLVAGQGLSRAAMTLALRHGPYLRPVGSGSGMTGPLGRGGAAALAIAVLAALALGGWALGWVALGAGLTGLCLAAGGVWFWARRRLGGVTGDILGAVQGVGDLGFALGVLVWL